MAGLSQLQELNAEKAHKYQKGEVEVYGIVVQPVEETSIQVELPDDVLTWGSFPPPNFKLPDTPFESDVDKEKDLDFFHTNLAADGFFISAKAKTVLEQFDLGNHKFYSCKIVLQKGGLFKKAIKKECFWLHLIFNDLTDNFVNFPESNFRERITINGKLDNSEVVRFETVNALHLYKKEKHENWKSDSSNQPFHKVLAWELALNHDGNLPDILGFSKIDPGEKYFSKSLSQAIKKANLKGLEIRKTGKIKQK